MSEALSLRRTNREVFNVVLGNTDIREPLHSHQLQWMARWTQVSSSLSMRYHKHCAVTNAIKDRTGHHYLPVESTKPSYPCECKNIMFQSAEARGGGNGRFWNINNSVMRNNLNSFGSETSEKLYKHKLPASSMSGENFTSYHFQNSQCVGSEWMHFPMFDSNRKVETIMAPKKRTGMDTMAAKMNEQVLPLSGPSLDPHLIEFASKGIQHQHRQQNIAQNDKEMRTFESVEALSSYNFHSSNMTSNIQNDEENGHFCSGLAFKEHFANANLTYLKHELCCGSKHSPIMVSEMKTDNLCFGISRTRLKDGSNCCPGDVPRPCLAEERNKEIESVFCGNKTTLGLRKSNKMSNCSTIGSKKEEPQKFSNATQYLITNEVGNDLCHKDQTVGCSTISANVKETAFFEKFTLPTTLDQHGHREENFQTLVSPTKSEEGVEDIDTQYMEKEYEFLVKTDFMHIDVPESPEGTYFNTSSV